MLYIDFIDTETGKQVFEEGKTIEAQQAIIDIIQLRFDHIPENSIQMIKGIGDLKTLIKLRKFAIRDQSKDGFIQHLIQCYQRPKSLPKTTSKSLPFSAKKVDHSLIF